MKGIYAEAEKTKNFFALILAYNRSVPSKHIDIYKINSERASSISIQLAFGVSNFEVIKK